MTEPNDELGNMSPTTGTDMGDVDEPNDEDRAALNALLTIAENTISSLGDKLEASRLALAASEARESALREALTECVEHFDNRADADHQGDPMVPVPNAEMRMLHVCNEALSAPRDSGALAAFGERVAADARGESANAAHDAVHEAIEEANDANRVALITVDAVMQIEPAAIVARILSGGADV